MKKKVSIPKKVLFICLWGVSVFVFAFSALFPTHAQQLVDPQDQLLVFSPAANTFVKDVVTITIRAYDNDQSLIPLSMRLYDAATCNDVSYGKVTTRSSIPSDATNNAVITWNSRSTQSTSNLPDGTYCLQICTTMQQGTNQYSACNARNITIINNNQLPSIVSAPPTAVVSEGEQFSYAVQAQDPDNDQLTYRLITATPEFSIDRARGVITSQPLSARGNAALRYTLTVGVSDRKSGEVTQTFTVEVQAPQPEPQPDPQPTPQPDPQPQPDPTPEPEPQPEEPEEPAEPTEPEQPEDPEQPVEDPEEPEDPEPEEPITETTFDAPNSDTVVKETPFIISWQVAESDTLQSQQLEYSLDGESWLALGNTLSPTRNSFIWDTREIPDGSYYVRLVETFEDEQQRITESDQFVIRQVDTDGEDAVESIPLIINAQPENGSERPNDTSIAISAEFLPAQGAEIRPETAELLLNGRDYKENCVIDQESFLCTPTQPLEVGRNIFFAAIEDTSDQRAELEWIFTVVDVTGNSDDNTATGAETISIFGISAPRSAFLLILLILCIGAVLLVVPWVLYSMWVRRRSSSDQIVTTQTDTYTTDPNALQDLQAYSYDPQQVVTPDMYQPQQYDQASYSPQDYSYNYNQPQQQAPVDTTQNQTQELQPYQDPNQQQQDQSNQQYVEPTQTS